MPKTVKFWVARLREDLVARGRSETTWTGDYWKVLKHLPQGQAITKKMLHDLVLSTKPNTKTRKRTCLAVKALAAQAGLRYDPSDYAGNYSPGKAAPRQLPSDEEILEFWRTIKNPGWQWVWGAISAYGLRPHEAFFADIDDDGVCTVTEGKTGHRLVWPFHPEWHQQFNLNSKARPNVRTKGREHSAVGHSATRHFWEMQSPFQLYDLRHRYALRLMEYGVRDEIAAQMMGHSLEVHSSIYRRWTQRSIFEREFKRVVFQGDRPLPPGTKSIKS